MARKQKHEEHENHERWLVSYADFITLLFAFFVVMYSISSVNEGKYRVLSDTLNTAFKESGKSLKPIQIGKPAKTLNPLNQGVVGTSSVRQDQTTIVPVIKETSGTESQEAVRKEQAVEKINKEVETSFASFIDQNLMTLRKHEDSLEIELKSKILFPSGGARLSIAAEKILIRLATILARFPSSTQVEGHTDDSPVSSALYPSNWELSASRAATVADLFAEHGIDPDTLQASGYAEFRPLVENTTADQKRLNRRVVLFIKPKAKDEKPVTPGKLNSINNQAKPAVEVAEPYTQFNELNETQQQAQPASPPPLEENNSFSPITLPPPIAVPGSRAQPVQQEPSLNAEPES